MVETPNFEEPLSPKSFLKSLQQQIKEKQQLSKWLTILKKNQTRMEAIEHSNLQSRSLINEFEKVQSMESEINSGNEIADKNVNNVELQQKSATIKIDFNDVKEEIE